MIILKTYNNITYKRTILGKTSPGSIGNYWLLVEEYKKMDYTCRPQKTEKWRRVNYNEQFSIFMFNSFKELHCEYCGKENLIIIKWYEKQNTNIMCTVDHFLPKKDYPELTEDPTNLYISCHKCNNNKAKKIVDESTLKFKYDDNIRKNFIFDESLVGKKAFKK